MTSANVTDIPMFWDKTPANAPVADSSRNSSDFMQMMNDTVSKDSDGISILSDHLAKTGNNKDRQADESGVPMPAAASYRAPDRINTDSSTKNNITPEKADKAKAALETFSAGVNKAVKDELSVTDEEITEAMETLGLTYADLMIPANLQKLVAALSGDEQAADLLVSDTLPDLLSTVGDLTDNLLADAGLSAPEIKGVEVDMLLNGDIDEAGLKLNDAFAPTGAVGEPQDGAFEFTDEIGIEGLLGTGEPATEATFSPEPMIRSADDADAKDITLASAESKASEPAPVRAELYDETADIYDEPEQVINELVNATGGNATSSGASDTGSGSDGFSFNSSQRGFSTENAVHQTETANVQSFVQNVQTDAAEQAVEIVTRYTDVDAESVMQQIVSRASTTISETVSRMEMELNPQNLGRMILQVTQQEGAVTARLIAQSDAVREALESQLALLRDNLNAAGVKVEAVEISVGTHEFERALEEGMTDNTNDNNGGESADQSGEASGEGTSGAARGIGSINLNDPDAAEQVLNEDEILAANMMRDQGNSMNVRA